VRAARRWLAMEPDHAEAHNSLGAMLLAQGRHAEASASIARALMLAPELFETFSSVAATLRRVSAALDQAVQRAVAAWPRLLPLDELLPAEAWATVATDPMLLCVLQSSTVRDLELAKFLPVVRAALLDRGADGARQDDGTLLGLACALARQCFINE